MALAETETWQGGFIRDDSGNLVVTTDPAEEVFGTVVPGFVTDGDGRLVATYEPDEDTRTVVPGFVTDTSGRLAIASEVADPVYTVVPGFATDSSGYLSTQEAPSSGTYQEGFVRDTDGALGVGATYIASPYEEAVLALSPAIFLPLDAVNGLTDLSGNTNNGTAAGGITVGGTTGPLNVGDSGGTVFDGADDQITTTYNPFTDGTVRTYMGWAWLDSDFAGSQTLFSSVSGSALPLCVVDTNKDIYFGARNAAGLSYFFYVNGQGWQNLDQWTHWAFVFDEPNDTVAFYRDGVLQNTKAHTNKYTVSAPPIGFGRYSNNASEWDGKMAWVSVHETGLTDEQIAACYAAGS